MLADLKLGPDYDGLLYLADSKRNLQRIRSHHHVELELNVVIQGTITYVMNGRRFTFLPRTVLWLFPGQEHQMVSRSDDARFYVAAFKPALIDKTCRTDIYKGLKSDPGTEDDVLSTALDPESFDLVVKNMEWLMQGAIDVDLLNREAGFGPTSDFRFQHNDPDALNAGLRYLLLLCWRSQIRGNAKREVVSLHPAVRRALEILSESNAEHNLGELAAICGSSKSYLSRTFHRQVGVSLTRYRNSLRLSRFFELYHKARGENLTQAVYSAGFGSYAQFYKVFSEAYGCGPRACLITKWPGRRTGG